MKTPVKHEQVESRSSFIETLSDEFTAMTGCGVYVYFDPVYINQLFDCFINSQMPARAFARQCVKKALH